MPLEILAQDLTQSYRKESSTRPPVFCANIHVQGPAICVLMGESGAGKSTLLKTIGGVLRPRSGSLMFEGQELWTPHGPRADLLNRFGFCFQGNALFSSMSVL